MRSTLPTCFLIGLTVIACGRRDRERGLGAGADSAGIRDTTAVTPAPAPATDPSADSAVKARTSRITGDTAGRQQTQSGVTDKSGRSKLGAGVRKTRPDVNQPVTAKGDTLSTSPGSITDSLNRRALERMSGRSDTMRPIPTPTDTTRPSPVDTLQPSPTDSVRPTPRDTLLPLPPDSIPADTLRPLPGDTTRPKRDSTPR